MKNRFTRPMIISFFVIVITIFNFLNLSGSECIRAIHVVTLLVCGIGFGVFFMNLFGWLREKRN